MARIFTGIDLSLVPQNHYPLSSNTKISELYDVNETERRKKLMPFLWNTIKNKGQIWGNRNIGNLVEVANPYYFSFPGYNEIFCGYVDEKINSNNISSNENINIFEFLQNENPIYKNKIAIYSTWYINKVLFNNNKNNFLICEGRDSFGGKNPNSSESYLNLLKRNSFRIANDRQVYSDFMTFYGGLEYIKANKPMIFYFSFLEPDNWGHYNFYFHYALSINLLDSYLSQLWDYIQSDPFYKDKNYPFYYYRSRSWYWCKLD